MFVGTADLKEYTYELEAFPRDLKKKKVSNCWTSPFSVPSWAWSKFEHHSMDYLAISALYWDISRLQMSALQLQLRYCHAEDENEEKVSKTSSM